MENEQHQNPIGEERPADDIVGGGDNDGNISSNDSQSEEEVVDEEEEEGAGEVTAASVVEDPLPALMSQNDPRRMKLTAQERQWAIDIKTMIEMMPDMDSHSDYWYAQLALLCKNDVDQAVRRLLGLQDLREEYKILDTPQDGLRALQWPLQIFPGFYLSYSFSISDGTYVIVMDMTKFDTKVLTSEAKLNQFFCGLYYMHHALTPDLESIRKGTIGIMECDGVNWLQKPNFKVMAQVGDQLISHYPIKPKMKHYNTGVIFNMLATMLKKAIPKEDAENFEVGLTLDAGGRLDTICNVPTPQAAQQRLLNHLTDALQRRYRNEQSFSLEYEL